MTRHELVAELEAKIRESKLDFDAAWIAFQRHGTVRNRKKYMSAGRAHDRLLKRHSRELRKLSRQSE